MFSLKDVEIRGQCAVRRWLSVLLLSSAAGCEARGCSDAPNASTAPTTSVAPSASSTSPPKPKPQVRKLSSAMAHLPADCTAVARVNWKALASHPAFAPHLKAAYQPPAGHAPGSIQQKAFLDFLSQSNIDPMKDVHEIAVCLPSAEQADVVVAIGGDLPGAFLSLLKQHAPKGSSYEIEEREGIEYLELQGQYLMQAPDHAVLLGSDLPKMLAAYPTTQALQNYGVPNEGEISLVARGAAFLKILSPQVLASPAGALLRKIERVDGSLDLKLGHVRFNADLGKPAAAAMMKRQLELLMKQMLAEAERSPVPVRLMMAPNLALARSAKFTVTGSVLKLAVDLPSTMVEGLLQQVLGPLPAAVAGTAPTGSGLGEPARGPALAPSPGTSVGDQR